MDISIKVKKRRAQHANNRFKYLFPTVVSKLQAILNTCRYLNVKVNEFIGRSCLFISQHSTSFAALPETFGVEYCALIQRLSLKMDFFMKIKHEGDTHWPALLSTMTAHLPRLEWFELYSVWSNGSLPFPSIESGDPPRLLNNGTITRYQQERRVSRRFLAWLILRHPELDRLIVQTIQDPNEEAPVVRQSMLAAKYQGENVRHNWRKIKQITHLDSEPEMIIIHDEVPNTKAIRRIKWSDLCTTDDSKLIIHAATGLSKDTISTSEVGDANDRFFERLDARGYQPFSLFKEHGWLHNGPITVDKLIDAAYRHKENVERNSLRTGLRGNTNGRGGRGGRGRYGTERTNNGGSTGGATFRKFR